MSKLKSQSQAWTERNPLRVWRKKQNLTQMELGGLLMLSVNSLRNLEGGTNQPSTWTLEKIATIMQLEKETLNRRWKAWANSRPTT